MESASIIFLPLALLSFVSYSPMHGTTAGLFLFSEVAKARATAKMTVTCARRQQVPAPEGRYVPRCQPCQWDGAGTPLHVPQQVSPPKPAQMCWGLFNGQAEGTDLVLPGLLS